MNPEPLLVRGIESDFDTELDVALEYAVKNGLTPARIRMSPKRWRELIMYLTAHGYKPTNGEEIRTLSRNGVTIIQDDCLASGIVVDCKPPGPPKVVVPLGY